MPSRHGARLASAPCASRQHWRQISLRVSARRREEIQVVLPPTDRDSIKERQEYTRDLLIVTDGKKNNETRAGVETVRRIYREGTKLVAMVPTTVQELPEIPAFINGQARSGQKKFVESGEALDKKAAEMLLNLTDLKHQAYKDISDNPVVKFDLELDKLTPKEIEEMCDEGSRELAVLETHAGIYANAFRDLVQVTIREHGGSPRKKSLGSGAPDSDDIDRDIEESLELNEEMIKDEEDGKEDRFADAKAEPKKKAELSKKAKEDSKQAKEDTKKAKEDSKKSPTANLRDKAAELFAVPQAGKK